MGCRHFEAKTPSQTAPICATLRSGVFNRSQVVGSTLAKSWTAGRSQSFFPALAKLSEGKFGKRSWATPDTSPKARHQRSHFPDGNAVHNGLKTCQNYALRIAKSKTRKQHAKSVLMGVQKDTKIAIQNFDFNGPRKMLDF